jgi:hypothetical protein
MWDKLSAQCNADDAICLFVDVRREKFKIKVLVSAAAAAFAVVVIIITYEREWENTWGLHELEMR